MAVWMWVYLLVCMATSLIQAQDITQINTGGCGSTKGCFRSPDKCSGRDCDFFLTWRVDTDGNNVFEMSGKAQTYVAVGFSKSGKMADSDVYACTESSIIRSRNTVGNTNIPQPWRGIAEGDYNYGSSQIEQGGQIVDERVGCTFIRQAKSVNDTDDTYFDLSGNNSYYIIMAKSNRELSATRNIQYHDKRVIGARTRFSDMREAAVTTDSKLRLQKAHGCLMIIAWVGFASIGITMARYFKPVLAERKIFGKAAWFWVHRFAMMHVFSFTLIAFIIIFVSVEGFVDKGQGVWGQSRYAHAILGIFVTILAIVNPIMAFFRPHPGEPKRPIFNWAHRGVGISAHVLSMITISLGLRAGEGRSLINGVHSFVFFIMIIFIIFHCVVWIVLEVMNHLKSESKSDIPMENTAEPNHQGKNTNSNNSSGKNSTITNMLFYIYFAFVIVFVLIIFISVAVA